MILEKPLLELLPLANLEGFDIFNVIQILKNEIQGACHRLLSLANYIFTKFSYVVLNYNLHLQSYIRQTNWFNNIKNYIHTYSLPIYLTVLLNICISPYFDNFLTICFNSLWKP